MIIKFAKIIAYFFIKMNENEWIFVFLKYLCNSLLAKYSNMLYNLITASYKNTVTSYFNGVIKRHQSL